MTGVAVVGKFTWGFEYFFAPCFVLRNPDFWRNCVITAFMGRRIELLLFFLSAQFYRHAHARLKIAKKLSTLLSTPQAEIFLEVKFFFSSFYSIFAVQKSQSDILASIFPIFSVVNIDFFVKNNDLMQFLLFTLVSLSIKTFLIMLFFQSHTIADYRY